MVFRHQPKKRSQTVSPTAACEIILLTLAATLIFFWPGGLLFPQALAAEENGEEEAVKAAVEAFLRSYTEEAMLYTACDQTICTVAAPGVGQDGGQVFSISDEDVTLEELRKNIAFVEKKAGFYAEIRQIQGIYRENLQLSYTFRSLRFKENTCAVSVTETAVFYYTDSQQPSVYETIYSIDLVKLGQQWLVADITDGSRFDGLYKNDPSFDAGTALAELALELQTENCKLTAPWDPVGASGEQSGWIPYNGANAAAYAYTYSRQNAETARENYYNPQFKSYAGQGGDCMNFVSQCMWAGFGGSQAQDAISASASPMDTEGDSIWYSRGVNSDEEPVLSWVSCQSFRKYLTGELDGSGTAGSNAAADMGMYTAIIDAGPGSPITGVPVDSLIGAAAHVEGAGGPYAHAIILTAAAGTSRSDIWFCSHTKNLTHIKLGDYYFGPIKVYVPRYMRTGAPQAFIQADILPPVAASSIASVGFRTAAVSPDLCLVITSPDGTAGEPFTAQDTNAIFAEYLFSSPGLYRVDCTAAEETGTAHSFTFFICCYEPPTLPVPDTPQEVEIDGWDDAPDWLFS